MAQVVQGRTAAGQKPYRLQVKVGGEIARGRPGKNAWDAAVRTSVLPDIGHEYFILEEAIS